MTRRSMAEIAFRIILVLVLIGLGAFAFGLGEKGSDGGFFSPMSARILTFVLLAMVIGAGIRYRRLPRRHALGAALFWGGLILALMLGYSLVKSLGLTMAP